jgi:N utilization substance protein B
MNDSSQSAMNLCDSVALLEKQLHLNPEKKKRNKKLDAPIIGFRTASRLIAVQALYAMDISKKRPSDIIDEITLLHQAIYDSNLEDKVNDNIFNTNSKFDLDYVTSIIRGVVREQRVIDPLICDSLPEKWSFNRLDYVMKAILRIGIYELLFSPDIPPKVVINEYTNIASSFNLNNDNALINGILNAVYQSNNHSNHNL